MHATTVRARPAVGESDACARGSDASGRASRWPCPSSSTTPHEDRGRTGPGRRGTGTSTRRHGDRRTLLPRVPGHTVWVSRGGPQARVQKHTIEQLADVVPMVQILDFPRRWWNSWWTSSDSSIRCVLFLSRLSKCPSLSVHPCCSHSPLCTAASGTTRASADAHFLSLVSGAARRHSSSSSWRATRWSSRFSPRTEFNSDVFFS